MLTTVLLAVLCGHQVLGMPMDMSEMHKGMEACMQETGTTMDEVLSWADGGDATDGMKCMIKCVMMKHNVMSNTGELLLENMLAMLPAQEHANTKACVEIERGSDLCDLAYRHQLCLREKSPDFYAERIKMMATPAPPAKH